MSSRSLNKVMLIGNLTRDVEVRYTPSGTAVATFGLATNRSWSSGDGSDRQEETQFHRIVAWSKLAEICGQLLFKGRKIFIEGRLQTRKFTGQDGQQREITEIVAENMMILDTRNRDGAPMASGNEEDFVGVSEEVPSQPQNDEKEPEKVEKPKKVTKKEEKPPEPVDDSVNVEDIPF
ncbi:MAG: single-stranded DNA-binding protein [Microgenomates group bacterium]